MFTTIKTFIKLLAVKFFDMYVLLDHDKTQFHSNSIINMYKQLFCLKLQKINANDIFNRFSL